MSCIELSLTGSVVAMVIASVQMSFFSSECNAKTNARDTYFICFCYAGFSSHCYVGCVGYKLKIDI